jgi:hypothetical protein
MSGHLFRKLCVVRNAHGRDTFSANQLRPNDPPIARNTLPPMNTFVCMKLQQGRKPRVHVELSASDVTSLSPQIQRCRLTPGCKAQDLGLIQRGEVGF